MEESQENKSCSYISVETKTVIEPYPNTQINPIQAPKNKTTQKLIQISNSKLKGIWKIKVIYLCEQTQKHFFEPDPNPPKSLFMLQKAKTINFVNTHGRRLSCDSRRSCLFMYTSFQKNSSYNKPMYRGDEIFICFGKSMLLI